MVSAQSTRPEKDPKKRLFLSTQLTPLSSSIDFSIRTGSECVFSLEDRQPPPTRARIEELESQCLKLRKKCSLLESHLEVADPNFNASKFYKASGFEDDLSEDMDISPVRVDRDTTFDHLTKERQEDRLGIEEMLRSSMTILTEGEDEEEQTHFFGESALCVKLASSTSLCSTFC